MRSDRKRAEKLEKEKMKRNKKNRLSKFLSIIYILLAVAFTALVVWLNVLPAKFLIPAVAVLLLVTIFIVPPMFSRNGKTGRRRFSTCVCVLLIAALGVGTYYLGATADLFGNITGAFSSKEDFYLVVQASSPYEQPTELFGSSIGAYSAADQTYAEARNVLKGDFTVEYNFHEDLSELFNSLLSGDEKALFVSAASYESMKSQIASLEEKTRIIHTVSIKVERKSTTNSVKVTEESFNILISGIDVSGDIDTVSRSDVNMLVTVNPLTRKVLLTSIPRDYYVNLPGKGAMDKLTHSGLYGAEETVAAVEEFMGIDINYFVKVNYSTVTKLVDAIGGIEIDSPYAFYTHGMKDQYFFQQGYNYLDGRQALAYSRERKSWGDGDMRRNENQQLILKAILKKTMNSSTILADYTSILGAIKNNVETDMSKSEITSLIKMQINDMSAWDIQTQALKGEPDMKSCYSLGNLSASVVIPDETGIATALDKIMEIKGEGKPAEQQ